MSEHYALLDYGNSDCKFVQLKLKSFCDAYHRRPLDNNPCMFCPFKEGCSCELKKDSEKFPVFTNKE